MLPSLHPEPPQGLERAHCHEQKRKQAPLAYNFALRTCRKCHACSRYVICLCDKPILTYTCLKQYGWLFHSLADFSVRIRQSSNFMLFKPKVPNNETGLDMLPFSTHSGLPKLPKAPIPTPQGSARGGPFQAWEEAEGAELVGDPVHDSLKSRRIRTHRRREKMEIRTLKIVF